MVDGGCYPTPALSFAIAQASPLYPVACPAGVLVFSGLAVLLLSLLDWSPLGGHESGAFTEHSLCKLSQILLVTRRANKWTFPFQKPLRRLDGAYSLFAGDRRLCAARHCTAGRLE